MQLRKWCTALAVGAAMIAGGPALAQERLTVWWEKGFYKAEDDALFAVIRKFEERTKIKVDLSFYATQ